MDQKVRETAQRRFGTASSAAAGTVFLLGYSGGVDSSRRRLGPGRSGGVVPRTPHSESKRGRRLALVWRSLQRPHARQFDFQSTCRFLSHIPPRHSLSLTLALPIHMSALSCLAGPPPALPFLPLSLIFSDASSFLLVCCMINKEHFHYHAMSRRF